MRRLLLLLACLSAPLANAQTAEPGRLTWVGLGLGIGSDVGGSPNISSSFGRTTSLSLAADVHAIRGPLHVQAGASAQMILLDADGVYEGHLLAGTARTFGSGVVTVAAGPSLAHVVRSAYDPAGRFVQHDGQVVPGLYASVGVSSVLIPEVALGLEAFGHLNARTPVAGLRLTTGFGRLPRAVIR